MWNLLKKCFAAYIESQELLGELGIYVVSDCHICAYYFDPEQYDRHHSLPEDNSSI